MGADGVAAQGFDCMGQTVQSMRRQQQPIEQQGIGCNRGIAQACALHRDHEKHRLQGQAADKDVAVDRQ